MCACASLSLDLSLDLLRVCVRASLSVALVSRCSAASSSIVVLLLAPRTDACGLIGASTAFEMSSDAASTQASGALPSAAAATTTTTTAADSPSPWGAKSLRSSGEEAKGASPPVSSDSTTPQWMREVQARRMTMQPRQKPPILVGELDATAPTSGPAVTAAAAEPEWVVKAKSMHCCCYYDCSAAESIANVLTTTERDLRGLESFDNKRPPALPPEPEWVTKVCRRRLLYVYI